MGTARSGTPARSGGERRAAAVIGAGCRRGFRHGLTRPVLALLAIVALALVPAAGAQADGDPGSDVLVNQSLFAPSDLGLSVDQQVKLADLLAVAQQHGAPIRVAIVASRFDLGAVTALWRHPQAYAHFLGIELSLAYRGRLLIVMPNGYGVNWPGHPLGPAERAVDRVPIGHGDAGLITATMASVRALMAQGAGGHTGTVSTASAAGAGGSSNGASAAGETGGATPASGQRADGRIGLVAFGIVLLLAAIAAARFVIARRRRDGAGGHPARRRAAILTWRWAVPRLALPVALIVAVPVVLLSARAPSVTASPAAFNRFLDPGTPLHGMAPDFTLSDQFGRPVSLRSFRGKVVILAFNDSECTTVCPLTTRAMLYAKAMLGDAGSRVQLLGIDANPASTSIEDVWSYSELHGMLHAWHFLTGSLTQLKRVWKAYAVEAAIEHGEVIHTPALFVIGPQGREAKVYLTQMNYTAVDQQGKLLAQEASSLLPGHPAVHASVSYAAVPAIAPTERASLARAGGGRVALGPGHGAHLYLFFATWDQEITSLAGHLSALDAYASGATASGLPALTAVDEASVEASPSALTSFLGDLPRPLTYPVAIDATGRVADGYEVQGEPWFVLTSPSGQIVWYWQVSTGGWPSRAALDHFVSAALADAPRAPGNLHDMLRALAGSPAPLAALHAQASQILGDEPALAARIRTLRGYPIVINAWASWCTPCRSEFGLFAAAAAFYGRRVAFLGADTDDSAPDAQDFLRQYPVSYPSYETTTAQLESVAGIEGLPTTIYIGPDGRVVFVHTGQYESQGALDADITQYTRAR